MTKRPPSRPWRRTLSAEDIERVYGVTKIYLSVSRGEFPPPIWLGPSQHVWLDREVEAWNQARIAAREARIAARKAGKVVPLGWRRSPQQFGSTP